MSAGQSCSINVIFTPGSAGSFSATVSITDNAPNTPQSLALSGTGTAAVFVVAPQTGAGSTATVTAGQPASYALSLMPGAGYSGTVTLSCTGLPVNATCSFTPPTVTLAGGKAANFTVTIATEAAQPSHLSHGFPAGSILAGILLLLPWPFWLGSSRNAAKFRSLALVLLIAGMSVSGCGGGGSSGSGAPSPAMVAPGTYTVQVVATDGTTMQTESITLVVK